MSSQIPENANNGCIGPTSENAGKEDGCDGCPNQSICSSGEAKRMMENQMQGDPIILSKLSTVKHTILVLSGKGGVGKTTVACQLAYSLASKGNQVGILDIDICGPSVPQVMGLVGQEVHQSSSGWSPVYVDDNLGVMSIGFMLPNADDAIVWRGPRKNGLIKQFLTDVDWGSLDYLIIDTPPGTSDEHLSILQYLKGSKVDGAVVVTTPQEVAMADVRKELSFCKKTDLKCLGVIENMSTVKVNLSEMKFVGPNGENISDQILQAIKSAVGNETTERIICETNIFVSSNIEKNNPHLMSAKFNVPFLGSIPLDPNLLKACDEGQSFVENYPSSPAAQSVNNIVDALIQKVSFP